MQTIGIGNALPQQLLHFLHPLIDILIELASSLAAFLLTLSHLGVSVCSGDAFEFTVVDFIVEFDVDVFEEEMELFDLVKVVLG